MQSSVKLDAIQRIKVGKDMQKAAQKYRPLLLAGCELEGKFSPGAVRYAREHTWSVGEDGSVRDFETVEPSWHVGEIRTTPASEVETRAALSAFPRFGYNHTCGFHVHISLAEDNGGDWARRKKLTGLMGMLTSPRFVEYFRYRMKRELPEEYDKRRNVYHCKYSYTKDELPGYAMPNVDRYRAINFAAWHRHGTIEFRIFPMGDAGALARYVDFTVTVITEYLAFCEAKLAAEEIAAAEPDTDAVAVYAMLASRKQDAPQPPATKRIELEVLVGETPSGVYTKLAQTNHMTDAAAGFYRERANMAARAEIDALAAQQGGE